MPAFINWSVLYFTIDELVNFMVRKGKNCTYVFRPSVLGTVLRSCGILPKAAHETDTSYPWGGGTPQLLLFGSAARAQLNAFLWATFRDVLFHAGILLCSSAIL